MSKKDYVKMLKESFSFALLAMGIYNVAILIHYFRQGMDRAALPSNMYLFFVDAIILVGVTACIMVVELISCKVRKNKKPDDSRTDA